MSKKLLIKVEDVCLDGGINLDPQTFGNVLEFAKNPTYEIFADYILEYALSLRYEIEELDIYPVPLNSFEIILSYKFYGAKRKRRILYKLSDPVRIDAKKINYNKYYKYLTSSAVWLRDFAKDFLGENKMEVININNQVCNLQEARGSWVLTCDKLNLKLKEDLIDERLYKQKGLYYWQRGKLKEDSKNRIIKRAKEQIARITDKKRDRKRRESKTEKA